MNPPETVQAGSQELHEQEQNCPGQRETANQWFERIMGIENGNGICKSIIYYMIIIWKVNWFLMITDDGSMEETKSPGQKPGPVLFVQNAYHVQLIVS